MASIVGTGNVSDSPLPGIRSLPTIATLADGRFLIAWMDNSEAGLLPPGGTVDPAYFENGWQVRARLFSEDGTPLGAEFRVDSPGGMTPRDQWFPQVLAQPDGTFLVAYETAWRHPPEDPLDVVGFVPDLPPYFAVVARTVTPQANAAPSLSSQVALYTVANTLTYLDDLALQTDGRRVAAISHYAGTWDVATERYLTLGEHIGSITQGDPAAAFVDGMAETIGAGGSTGRGVKLAALPGGGHVLAWERRDGVSFNFDVVAQVLDAPGGGSALIPVAVAAGSQAGVEVAALATGNFVVTWVDHPTASTRGRVFDPHGNAVTPVLALAGPGHDFDAISLADGGFALTWVYGPAVVGTVYLAAFGYDGSVTMAPQAIAIGDHPRIAQQPDGDLLLVTRNEVMTFSIVRGVTSNIAPQSIALAAAAIPEDATAGMLVGVLSAIDPDSPGAPVFSIVADDGRFRIVGSQLLLNGPILDFETRPIENVTVRATDTSGNSIDSVVSFAVADANDEPTGVVFTTSGAQTILLAENPQSRAVIGQLVAVDQDALDVNKLALIDDGGGAFGLTGAGLLFVRDPLRFDAERLGGVSGAVTSTRKGVTTGPLYFSVVLQDVDPETVSGDSRNNEIYGGTGNDVLRGGDGDDRLYGERPFSFQPGGADILNGGNGDDFLFGGRGDDELIGDDGNDILDGGDGADRQKGGNGNDAIVVRYGILPSGELIDGGNGQDIVFMSGDVDFRNASVRGIEAFQFDIMQNGVAIFAQEQIAGIATFSGNMVEPGTAMPRPGDSSHTLSIFLRSAGTLDLSAKTLIDVDEVLLNGSSRRDILVGTAQADVLDGGDGADEMTGNAGDDTYLVDDAGDTVVEVAGGGIDTVRATVSWTLGAHVENLSLEGLRKLTGRGNDLDNVISGTIVNDRLNGGLGNDTLIGGAGRDWFVFDGPLTAGNVDTVADFAVADDRFELSGAAFDGLAPGRLATDAFRIGVAAFDADDRILYDAASGTLRFDSDGTGMVAAEIFAVASPGLALKASHFLVV
jgi:Ca2+-binding RTX toxin-like protein